MPKTAAQTIADLTSRPPATVVAIHVNFASRAAQRGRAPRHPSYFLKPASSLSLGGAIARPAGTQLLGFEGEIAAVIGSRARNVDPAEAYKHVGWITAAGDFGLFDLKYADRGSNLRAKGGDGFTPVGPRFLPAADLDPARLRLRTWRNGHLVQDDSSATMLFAIGELVADLSRTMTLDVGDIILTGTPAGAGLAEPGDLIEVEVSSQDEPAVSSGRLAIRVQEGPALADWGAPARADRAARQAAAGPAMLAEDVRTRLGAVATATLSVQLRARGLGDATIDGVRPLRPGARMVGTARTLRYVPFRRDLFEERGGGFNAQKEAIDSLAPGEVLVMDARRDPSAGTLGDILALRAKVRGAAGVVSDGAVRDAAAVRDLGLPVFAAGAHPAVLGRRHVPWERDVTIACGGATIQVGDVIVGDDDGVVVIPRGLVEDVLADAEKQELLETFVAEQVAQGESVEGLYPPNAAWRERFERWRSARAESTPSDQLDRT